MKSWEWIQLTLAHLPCRLLQNVYTDPSIDSEVEAFGSSVRAQFEAVSGFAAPHVYVNYDHGDEGPAALWGSSLPKLRAVKAKWDPNRVFGTPNPFW
jgi:fumiquinazoline A oxidase